MKAQVMQATTRLEDIIGFNEQPGETELIAIFPEAKSIVPRNFKRYKKHRAELVKYIEAELSEINKSPDETYRYYWRKVLMMKVGDELSFIDRQLAELSRLLRVIKGTPLKQGQLTQALIEAARAVPIESLLDQQLRRSGKDLLCLCIFHNDHEPSLRIYTEQNRAWCFSCSNGGDSIQIAMSLHGYGFKEAVLFLTGGGHES